jgi:preprotein translocase subunit SecG
MQNLVSIIHILAAIGVIGLVLIQHGKGADMGAAFGSGTSGSLFGVTGSSNLLSKLTAACVTIFFITSLTLAYMASHHASNSSVVKSPATQTAPAGNTSSVKPAVQTLPAETKATETTPALPASPSAKDVPK